MILGLIWSPVAWQCIYYLFHPHNLCSVSSSGPCSTVQYSTVWLLKLAYTCMPCSKTIEHLPYIVMFISFKRLFFCTSKEWPASESLTAHGMNCTGCLLNFPADCKYVLYFVFDFKYPIVSAAVWFVVTFFKLKYQGKKWSSINLLLFVTWDTTV